MTRPPRAARPPRAVTFDCWGTLLYEGEPERARQTRLQALERALAEAGMAPPRSEVEAAFAAAHQRHVELWEAGVASGSGEMARWMLERFALPAHELDARAIPLCRQLQEAAESQEIRPLDGARETLLALEKYSIRRALICDTGFSPARIVRRFLDRLGLLELLEVQVFSDEAGVPKPHPRTFRAALQAFRVDPRDAVHVGDLRRTDIAGARALGMGTVRIRSVHDDRSAHPEADAVADSHAHLRAILALE